MTLTEFRKHFNVSRETISYLTLYESLLKKWNQKTNLVSKNSLDDAWGRHFLDSAQLVKHCQPENKLWLDFGSGAGFPGVVSAIILRDRGINTNFVLVEKNKTKAFFLGELKRRLDLSLDIICENRNTSGLEDWRSYYIGIIHSKNMNSNVIIMQNYR